MPRFLLHHQHAPDECAAAFAAWRGFESPLRSPLDRLHMPHGRTRPVGHVEATDPAEALELLPRFVARRTHPIQIREVQIP